MKRFVIISNEIKDNGLVLAGQIKEKMLELNSEVTVSMYEMDTDYIKDIRDAQCILVLGGDGTLLRVAKDTVSLGIPVIGVNLGAIGFLAEVEPKNIDTAIKALINDEYHMDERMMISGSVCKKGVKSEGTVAFNDVVLSRRGELQVVGYRVYVNDLYLNDFYADGMIVSTPTGSTGYNMSAGGSIVEPMASLLVLTPVCPHTLSTRSIILSSADAVRIEVLPPKGDRAVEVGVYFDGRNEVVLTEGDSVLVSKTEETIKLCRISDQSFLEVLNKKFNE